MLGPAFLIGVVVTVLANCGKHQSSSESPTPTVEPKIASEAPTASPPPGLPLTVEPNKESIQNNYVNINCISCHSNAAASNRYVDLRDLSLLIVEKLPTSHHHDSARLDLIVKGCPNFSFFYAIIKSGEMPLAPKAHATTAELKSISDWIVGLKPNADCTSDEPTDPGAGHGDEP